jgi:DNA repair protein RecN (Recombination protein N)
VDVHDLVFSPGFTVITGETGSGKSILLTAIGLLLGEKSDSEVVRHGHSMGVIEAEFDVPKSSTYERLLKEQEIDIEGPTLTVRREVHASGKSRSFVCGQLVPLHFLKRFGGELIEIADQNASLSLRRESAPLELLDIFGNLSKEVDEFHQLYSEFREVSAKIKLLQDEEPFKESEIESLEKKIAEIDSSKIFHVDDSALFLQFQQIEAAKESFQLGSTLLQDLEGGKYPLLPQLHRWQQRMEKLASSNPLYQLIAEQTENACSGMREAAEELQRSLSSVEYSEEQREEIEKTLFRIDQVRRRYGSHEEVQKAYGSMKERLCLLQHRDVERLELQQQLEQLTCRCDTLSYALHEKRTSAARTLEPLLEQILRRLNMPHAKVKIDVQKTSRSSNGETKSSLLITPNIGEKQVNIHDGLSGGELARLYIAWQLVLADRFSVPTLIFDEVDASIGGLTANTVADILASISTSRQVIAITHFAQVASRATTHLALAKSVLEGRTISTVDILATKEAKQREQERMMGVLTT